MPAVSTFQIVSIRPNGAESIVAVQAYPGTAKECLENYKATTPTMRDNSYKAVKVG